MKYDRHDIDRLYRNLPEDSTDLWVTQPNYDSQPRERRPVDELPMDVTHYLNLVEAVERLSGTQRTIFQAVVMGVFRVYDKRTDDYVLEQRRPMTYRECARYQGLSEGAVGMQLRRARTNLAKILSDIESDEEEAA